MPVGFHVLERTADIVEGEHLVDRQLQLSRFHRGPDVFPDFVKNLADFFDRAGAEGDADVVDAAGGAPAAIEFGAGAAPPSASFTAAPSLCGGEILSRGPPRAPISHPAHAPTPARDPPL